MTSKSTASAPPPPTRSKPTISSVDRAILDLKNNRDRLHRYRRQLEQDEIKLLQRAKECKQAGKTTQAMGLLKLKKYKRQQLESVEEQLLTVMTMVETIDSKQNEKQLLDALKSGKDALNQMHQETSIDTVLELMDGVTESIETEQEINNILNDAVPTDIVMDEAAVEEELRLLEEQVASEQQATTTLPEVPTHKLPEPQQPVPAKAQPERQRVAVPG